MARAACVRRGGLVPCRRLRRVVAPRLMGVTRDRGAACTRSHPRVYPSFRAQRWRGRRLPRGDTSRLVVVEAVEGSMSIRISYFIVVLIAHRRTSAVHVSPRRVAQQRQRRPSLHRATTLSSPASGLPPVASIWNCPSAATQAAIASDRASLTVTRPVRSLVRSRCGSGDGRREMVTKMPMTSSPSTASVTFGLCRRVPCAPTASCVTGDLEEGVPQIRQRFG